MFRFRSVGVHNTEYEVADRGSRISRASPQRNGDSFAMAGTARSLEVYYSRELYGILGINSLVVPLQMVWNCTLYIGI